MNSAAVEERALPAFQPRADAEQGTTGELLRLLAGFTALGSGLTFFALAADALLAAGGILNVVVGMLTGLWAAALTLWGILALRGTPGRNRVPALLAVVVPAVLPGAAAVVLGVLVWGALLAPAESRNFDLTLASALALVLLQLGCRGALHRRADRSAAGAKLSPGRLLTGLFLCAVLVAGITTPGLAASTAGDNAVPHGEHGLVPAPAEHPGH
ncbi:hypothetical protein GCM10009784_30770 [Arthrobacter parietis]|uniref:Uncharacterized protein n=1 Tax=Arthrobacter parietis TaxID=271434 RepID=A0ABN3B1T5_9MICC